MIGAIALAADVSELADSINAVWILAVSFIIFFMQPGFLLLESGQVRSKNVANVAMKNLLDWSLGVLVFFVVGLGLANAVGALTAPGTEFSLAGSFAYVTAPEEWIGWFFAAVFAMTAATIVSGAVAERVNFISYVLYSAVLTAAIYPVVVGLTWQDGLLSEVGYLGQLLGVGYLDFAGSTVVHMVGGLAGITAAAMIGPRADRYDENGDSKPIPGHSVLFAVVGTLFLAFGWFGFNVGTQATVLTDSGEFLGAELGRVVVVTTLGMGAGAVASSLVTIYYQGKPDPLFTANGLLAGLVAVTGGAAYVTWWGGLLLGAIGGALVYPTFRFVVDDLGIDDVCGVFGVHGGAGAIGVVLIPFVGVGESGTWTFLGTDQVVMQVAGVLLIGLWTVVATVVAVSAIGSVFGLRTDEAAQRSGLDRAEHNVVAYPQFVTDGGIAAEDTHGQSFGSQGEQEHDEPTTWRGEDIGGSNEEQSRSVLDGAGIDGFPEPTVVVDDEDRITAMNARGERFFETTVDAVEGDSPKQLAGAEGDVLDATADALRTGSEVRERSGSVTVAGASIPVATTATVLREDHTPVGAMLTVRNTAESVAAARHRRTVEEYTDEAIESTRNKLSDLADGAVDVDAGVPEPPADGQRLDGLHETFRELDALVVETADNVAAIVERLPEQSAELASTSTSLSESNTALRESIEEVDDVAGEIDDSAEDLSARTEDVWDSVQHLSASIEQITASAQQIRAQSQDATERTERSAEQIVDAADEIGGAAEETDAAVEEIKTLREDIRSVADVTDIIQDIAEQTNVLALNAAVEAANAEGDTAGFAVVADEVKQLAEKTQTSAEEIETIVDEAQRQTEAVADRIVETNDRIVEGVDVVESTADELATVADRISETNEGIAEISDAVERQAENATTVSEAVRDIDERADEISDRTAGISEMVGDERESVATVTDLSDRLADLATEIHDNVDQFDLQSTFAAGHSTD